MAKRILFSLLACLIAFVPASSQQIKRTDAIKPSGDNAEVAFAKRAKLDINALTNESSSLIPEFGVKGIGENVIIWSENFNDGNISDWTIEKESDDNVWKLKKMTGSYSFTEIDLSDKFSLHIDGHYRLPKETTAAI